MVELRCGYEVAYRGSERESVANLRGELQTPDFFLLNMNLLLVK